MMQTVRKVYKTKYLLGVFVVFLFCISLLVRLDIHRYGHTDEVSSDYARENSK